MKSKKTTLRAVSKVAILGGFVFATLTILMIVCCHLFGHGTGENSAAMSFAIIRGMLNLPLYLLIGNRLPPAPFNGIFTDDLLCLLTNAFIGAFIFSIVSFIWHFLKKDNNEK
ncbi:MAG TPA: hypothetical protein VGI03_03730 [Verrucomicrobiae bacterium]|jgi:hypothetical protein